MSGIPGHDGHIPVIQKNKGYIKLSYIQIQHIVSKKLKKTLTSK